MNLEHPPLQHAIDELFALQEKVKQDHHTILRAVKDMHEQSCQQNNQGKNTSQESLSLLKRYAVQLTDTVSQLKVFGRIEKSHWRQTNWLLIFFGVLMTVCVIVSTYFGYRIGQQEMLIRRLNYKLKEIPIAYHDKQGTYVKIKKDSQLKIKHQGRWEYYAELVRPTS